MGVTESIGRRIPLDSKGSRIQGAQDPRSFLPGRLQLTMYLLENPVLQRELLVNLRTGRSFLLMAAYQVLLAVVVLVAWPSDERLDLSSSPPSARRLVDLFFLGQYVIASLMAPSFAAGAITGEKERMTYELLLATPLRPVAIIIGKMIASLTHLAMIIVASLPIIVLCLPLGGLSVYEVLAAYLGLIVSVILFGAIGIACSSYFHRTSASLVVSYLTILPLVMAAIWFWRGLEGSGALRLQITTLVIPAFAFTAVILLCGNAAGRMLYPPDVGSEGKDVIDLEQENEQAVGLVINRDQFPDRLFAPPKKQTLMADGANPVYDKEIHSEIFSQGTLMLRLVIQISMLLALPLMAWLLFISSEKSPWFVVFVVVFNMLVGPVFLAGAISGERERQTLDLLLTSTVTASQLMWGKLLVGLRVSCVLTGFLLWPLLLAALFVDSFWSNWLSVLLMFAIVAAVCVSNGVIALFCSSLMRKTSVALLATYTIILSLYALPIAGLTMLEILQPDLLLREAWLSWTTTTSPFAALFALPLDANLNRTGDTPVNVGDLRFVLAYFVFTSLMIACLLGITTYRLRDRSSLVGE
jgi:ABC-type transport system involved in multi-copper enzyme maturation permease subunit